MLKTFFIVCGLCALLVARGYLARQEYKELVDSVRMTSAMVKLFIEGAVAHGAGASRMVELLRDVDNLKQMQAIEKERQRQEEERRLRYEEENRKQQARRLSQQQELDREQERLRQERKRSDQELEKRMHDAERRSSSKSIVSIR